MWTRWRLFSYIDCFHLWTVFTCRQFSVVDVDFSHMGCFQLLTVFTCGLHINSLQTLTTNWLFTQVASMLTVYSSGQHIDSLHKWTACWLFTQVDSMLTLYTSGQHVDYLHKWTAYWLFTQVDSILSVYTSGQHVDSLHWLFTQVDSMLTVYASGQHSDYLHKWTAYRVWKSRQHVYCFLKFDLVDCVQITMNTGQLLRTVTDWHCGLCSDHHVGPEHRQTAEDHRWCPPTWHRRSSCKGEIGNISQNSSLFAVFHLFLNSSLC